MRFFAIKVISYLIWLSIGVDGLSLRLACPSRCRLTDSLSIILSKRPNLARVAPQIADKGYCPTKQRYLGLKLYVVGTDRLSVLFLPERMQLSKVLVHDLKALRQHTLGLLCGL